MIKPYDDGVHCTVLPTDSTFIHSNTLCVLIHVCDRNRPHDKMIFSQRQLCMTLCMCCLWRRENERSSKTGQHKNENNKWNNFAQNLQQQWEDATNKRSPLPVLLSYHFSLFCFMPRNIRLPILM